MSVNVNYLMHHAGVDTAEADVWSSSRRDNTALGQRCLFKITVPPAVCHTDLVTGSVFECVFDIFTTVRSAQSS